jgi:hypothetical protein
MKFLISAIIILTVIFQAFAKENSVSALLTSQTAETFIYTPDTIHLSAAMHENLSNSIKLEWTNPYQTQLTMIVDDGSFENSRNIPPLMEGWLGNYFPDTWVCRLFGAELFWTGDSMPSGESLTVDIFDANHNLLGSSDPFFPLAGAPQIVHLPLIQINGPFYAMVHWNNLSGESLKLGSDENGPGAGLNYGWYYNGLNWSHPSDSGFSQNVFGIRVIGAINGKSTASDFVFSEEENSALDNMVNDQILLISNSEDKPNIPCRITSLQEITEYRIFRRAYLADPPGVNDPGNGDFVSIATVAGNTNQFVDNDLLSSPQNCYEYKVQGFNQFSDIINSNIDWECLTVGIEEIDSKSGISPNPANESVRLEFPAEIKYVSVFNASGQKLNFSDVTNQTSLSIYTFSYLSGIYFIRFDTANGDSFTRKLVVLH